MWMYTQYLKNLFVVVKYGLLTDSDNLYVANTMESTLI